MFDLIVYLIVYLIVIIVRGAIWGIATNYVLENKGYNENWFWWGFFFGLIALIVALTKPDIHSSYKGRYHEEIARSIRENDLLRAGGWKCTCGSVNANYVSTCSCGRNKRDIDLETARKENANNGLVGQEIVMDKKEQAEAKTISAIKEYKELLDAGILTEEEFEAKKKQLLGL